MLVGQSSVPFTGVRRWAEPSQFFDFDRNRGSDLLVSCDRRMEVIERVAPKLSVERLVDHVVHAAEIAGVESVGLGSDFDGIDWVVEGVVDVTGYGRVAEAMRRRGFNSGEVEGVMGGNLVRVFSEVTGDCGG